MAAPPYHLRTNKAVDRHLFMEAVQRCVATNEMTSYTYFGLGGPYLEDFRIFHEMFPETKMVSIENRLEVFKRQQFHKPNRRISLVYDELSSFLKSYSADDKKSIFWLDYTDLSRKNFKDFMLLLSKVVSGSIVKITLKAQPADYAAQEENEDGSTKDSFCELFEEFLPAPDVKVPWQFVPFCDLLQKMLRIAAQRALSGTNHIFQPLGTFCYNDGKGMFTLTGMVCTKEDSDQVKEILSGWKYANLHWRKKTIRINVPILSTQERLHLQRYLPAQKRKLVRHMKYKIDGSNSNNQMKQYADFYRQYPYFIKAVP